MLCRVGKGRESSVSRGQIGPHEAGSFSSQPPLGSDALGLVELSDEGVCRVCGLLEFEVSLKGPNTPRSTSKEGEEHTGHVLEAEHRHPGGRHEGQTPAGHDLAVHSAFSYNSARHRKDISSLLPVCVSLKSFTQPAQSFIV